MLNILINFKVNIVNNIFLLWGGVSSYKTYIFKESIRHYMIDYKGQGRKEGDIPIYS